DPVATAATDLKGKGTHRVRFANVDDRLIVWVGNSLPFKDGVSYTPLKERGPYANDLQPAGVGVKGSAVRLGKLKLFRDTYYTVEPGKADAELKDAAIRDMIRGGEDQRATKLTELHNLLSDPDRYGKLRDLPSRTMYVQPGHYLCMGDNSPES